MLMIGWMIIKANQSFEKYKTQTMAHRELEQPNGTSIMTRTSAAERMRKSRARRALGYRVFQIEVTLDAIETLVELNYLKVDELQDRCAISAALSQFVEEMSDDVTSNKITLARW